MCKPGINDPSGSRRKMLLVYLSVLLAAAVGERKSIGARTNYVTAHIVSAITEILVFAYYHLDKHMHAFDEGCSRNICHCRMYFPKTAAADPIFSRT
jgi:hypothetical protein